METRDEIQVTFHLMPAVKLPPWARAALLGFSAVLFGLTFLLAFG